MLTYEVGERILARNKEDPIFYEAKIIKNNGKDDEKGYKVHYVRWSKSYDEVISFEEMEGRTKKFTAEALQQAQAQLAAAKKMEKSNNKRRSKTQTTPSTKRSCSKKVQRKKEEEKPDADENANLRAREKETAQTDEKQAVQAEEKKTDKKGVVKADEMMKTTQAEKKNTVLAEKKFNFQPAPEYFKHVQTSLPGKLKTIFVDDAMLINEQGKIYQLPAKIPAQSIISDYLESRISHQQDDEKVQLTYLNRIFTAGEVRKNCENIQDFMDIFLVREHLYSPELQQYYETAKKHQLNPSAALHSSVKFQPSHVYGFPHLVRCLTHFEYLDKEIPNLASQSIVADFACFLEQSRQKYFAGEQDYADRIPKKPLD